MAQHSPPEIVEFLGSLAENEYTLDTGFAIISFCRPSKLEDYQGGFAWDGNTKEPLDGWEEAWTVFADRLADPLIYDAESGRVLFDLHGRGTPWAPHVAFDSPEQALEVARALRGIYRAAGDSFYRDDDFNVASDVVAEAKELIGRQVAAGIARTAMDVFELNERT